MIPDLSKNSSTVDPDRVHLFGRLVAWCSTVLVRFWYSLMGWRKRLARLGGVVDTFLCMGAGSKPLGSSGKNEK